MKLKSLLVLTLMLGTAFSQQPSVKHDLPVDKPKVHHNWFYRHPVITGLIAGVGVGFAVKHDFHSYKCYSEPTEGTYVYTGTPWSGAGPNGCPVGQVKK